MSYNIHKGYDWKNQIYFLREVRQLIQSSDADLVFLQEVTGKNDQYKKVGLVDAQFEFLADSLWTEHAYAKNAVYDHGHHGNMLLSKFPILNWENVNISTNIFENRGLLIGQIQIPQLNNKIVHAGCLHLNLLQAGRSLQYQMIRDKIMSLNLAADAPLVIAGDFNDWNKKSGEVFESSLEMKEVYKTRHGRFARTFPAGLPLLSLDRVYVKNMSIIDSKIWPAPDHRHFSDHLPIFCEVEI